MFEKYPDVVDVKRLCKMLNIGRNTAYKLLIDKKIFAIRIGKTYKIPKKAVIGYLANK